LGKTEKIQGNKKEKGVGFLKNKLNIYKRIMKMQNPLSLGENCEKP
jgi:ribosomal protein S30